MPRPRRPRPIPPDPENLNNERADWALTALAAFMNRTGADPEDALADLLADLRHWCDRNNTSFMLELRRAQEMYREETLADEHIQWALVIPMPPDTEPPF